MIWRGTIFLCLLLLLFLLPSHTRTNEIEVAFSPHGQSLQLVLSTIKSAKQSIRVAAYSFTSKPVAETLKDVHRRGIDVKVVADRKGNSDKYTAVTFLANQGIPVRMNGNYAIHHHKFMVIDGQHVQTGSFNYSAAAVDKNAENVIVVRGDKGLAGQYAKEWERLWDEGVDVKPTY